MQPCPICGGYYSCSCSDRELRNWQYDHDDNRSGEDYRRVDNERGDRRRREEQREEERAEEERQERRARERRTEEELERQWEQDF